MCVDHVHVPYGARHNDVEFFLASVVEYGNEHDLLWLHFLLNCAFERQQNFNQALRLTENQALHGFFGTIAWVFISVSAWLETPLNPIETPLV